jgi:hypothetical protein
MLGMRGDRGVPGGGVKLAAAAESLSHVPVRLRGLRLGGVETGVEWDSSSSSSSSSSCAGRRTRSSYTAAASAGRPRRLRIPARSSALPRLAAPSVAMNLAAR